MIIEPSCEECCVSSSPLRLVSHQTKRGASNPCITVVSFMLLASCELWVSPTPGGQEQVPSENSSCRAETSDTLVGALASSVKLADLPSNHRFVFAERNAQSRNDASRLTLAVNPRSGRIVEAYCG